MKTVLQNTLRDTVEDVGDSFRKNQEIPRHTAAVLLRAFQGFFGAFVRKWHPISFRPTKNLFSGYIEHATHPKKVISVGFWSHLVQELFPPSVSPCPSSKTFLLSAHRFTPYDSEIVYFPLAVFTTIVFIILFFVIIITITIQKRSV